VPDHPLLPAELQRSYRERGLWEDTSLMEILVARATSRPDAPLYLGEESKTYREVADAAAGFAAALAADGVGRGDTVVAPLVSGWQATVVSAAASALGAVLAPLPSRCSPAQACLLAEVTEAPVLVISGRVLTRPGWEEVLADLGARAPSIRRVYVADPGAAPAWAEAQGHASVPDACAGASLADLAAAPRDPTELALLLSTGGTTGPSKVVMHCEQAIVYAAGRYAQLCGLGSGDVVLSAGPYGHASGTVFTLYAPIIAGAAVLPLVFWDPARCVREVTRHGVSWGLFTGTHIYDLLGLPEEEVKGLASLRGISAGSGSDALYLEAERRFGFAIRRMYGLSECLGHALMPLDAALERRMTRDGLPFEGIEAMILDQAGGEPLGPGEVGEYVVRGPSLFMGYLGRAELTAESVHEGGYLRTGDLMSIDDHGCVKYIGRLKDVIRRAGVNIDPMEVERVLIQHPRIADVSIVGLPDPRLGERAVAAIERVDGAPPTLDAIVAFLSEREVPIQSHPERLVVVEEIPRTEFGKHNKAKLREQLLAETEQEDDLDDRNRDQ